MSEEFGKTIEAAYAAEGPTVDLGRGVHEGALSPEAVVQIPLRMMNRHGLVAGATGTGKTVTLQTIAEQLSSAGVAVFAADVKGDVSGVAVAGETGGSAEKRMTELGLPFEAAGFPVEYLSLGGLGPGVPVRATVTDFGPQLLAKILKANQTQEDSLALVFHYADEKGLPLLDLADLRALLTFLESDAGKAELEGIGGLASSTVGVLLRALVGLENGGGTRVLRRAAARHRGPDSDSVRRPRGDLGAGAACGAGQAQAVLDGAHVAARRALRAASGGRRSRQAEARLLLRRGAPAVRGRDRRLPRVRDPDGPPHPVQGRGHLLRDAGARRRPRRGLGQLGNRVQHALRAFTPDDAKALRAAASTYPKSDFYDVDELLTSMGIGEAAVTTLSDEGVPTPVVHTKLRAPASRIGPADDVDGAAKELTAVRQVRNACGGRERTRKARDQDGGGDGRRRRQAERRQAARPASQEARPRLPSGGADVLGDFLTSREGKAMQRTVLRGVFGMLRKRL